MGRDAPGRVTADPHADAYDAVVADFALRNAVMPAPLVEADMRALPFADASFDGVWCIASLLHLPKSEAPSVLAEIHRVRVEGGGVAVSLKRGAGERWEAGPVGWPDRFFARYEAVGGRVRPRLGPRDGRACRPMALDDR